MDSRHDFTFFNQYSCRPSGSSDSETMAYGLITNNSCADLESWGGGQGVPIPPPAIKIIFHHPLERTSRSAHAIFENLKIKTEKK